MEHCAYTLSPLYRQACAKRGHGYCFTQWSKIWFFAPQGRHVAPINVKFGTARGSVPNQKCGNTASKTVRISNFGHKFAPEARLL